MTTTTTVGNPTLRTGIEILDKHLGGGLHPGSIIALLADPTSQSELLLARLAAERPTLYLTMQRAPNAVRRGLSGHGIEEANTVIHGVDPDDPLETAAGLINEITDPTTVIVDPANVIESSNDHRLWSFLNESQSQLTEVGGLLVLHCLIDEPAPPGRVTTTYMADAVFDLETDYGWETIENRLVVPKIRGGRPVKRALKLELTDDVLIDTSRDIA